MNTHKYIVVVIFMFNELKQPGMTFNLFEPHNAPVQVGPTFVPIL